MKTRFAAKLLNSDVSALIAYLFGIFAAAFFICSFTWEGWLRNSAVPGIVNAFLIAGIALFTSVCNLVRLIRLKFTKKGVSDDGKISLTDIVRSVISFAAFGLFVYGLLVFLRIGGGITAEELKEITPAFFIVSPVVLFFVGVGVTVYLSDVKEIRKKTVSAIVSLFVCVCVVVGYVPSVSSIISEFYAESDMVGVTVPDGFEEKLNADVFENNADVRVMSSNVLVDFDWGSGINPVQPRAAKFFKVLEAYRPDVVGIQEQSKAWTAVFIKNLPRGYKLISPTSDYLTEKMSTLIYNSDTLSVIDSGDYKYSFNGASWSTRRVAWGVFEVKKTGKRFAVTSTHLDFLNWDNESNTWADLDNRLEQIGSEADEMLATVKKLNKKYDCPVFSAGDYNTYDTVTEKGAITEIYSRITKEMTDSKFNCKESSVGDLTEITDGSFNQDCVSMNSHDGDHIFFFGNTEIKHFALLSYSYLYDISDHNSIFIDAMLK